MIIEFLIGFIGGILAGVLGGLLGIGGGIVLMPILRFLIGLPPAYSAGTCVVAVFFTTLGGGIRHYKLGNVNIKSIFPVLTAGAISSIAFSLIFLYIAKRDRWLDLGTGLVFSLVSIRMMIEGLMNLLGKKLEKSNGNKIEGSLLKKTCIGSIAGILPGLLGIGTGAILVPAFVFILNVPMKVAIGSSLVCFSVNAFISSIFKLFQGFVNLKVVIPISIGTLIGSNIGAILNKHFPSAILKIMFGVIFFYVSLQYILLFRG